MRDKRDMQTQLLSFMEARHTIYMRRAVGAPPPWTEDEILRTYRFCNVYRELDSVTQWIANNWRNSNQDDPNLWFAMCVARLFNLPQTLAEIKYPGRKWNPERVRRVLKERRERGDNVFNAAYIVSTNGRAMDKIDYVIDCVLNPMWEQRKDVGTWCNVSLKSPLYNIPTLQDVHARLTKFQGMGSFMAGQVVADLKYALGLSNAPDWWTWAASGPGSRRGLNRVVRRGVDLGWREPEWLANLQALQTWINARWPYANFAEEGAIHAQDLQNCLCEFDKYQRVKLGEGKPKQLYKGG